MSSEGDTSSAARPLVAVVCVVPLVAEAVSAALDFAEVRSFAGHRDTPGLLRWLNPDAVVVDNPEDAAEAAEFAQTNELPVVQVCVHDRSLEVFRDGRWHDASDEGPTPEAIRNVLAGSLFARVGSR